MVDLTPQGVAIVQISASAADGPSAWDLRCEIREGIVRTARRSRALTDSMAFVVAHDLADLHVEGEERHDQPGDV